MAAVARADEPKLERVEITGSSIKRIEGETALPVQVITRDEIQRTGAVSVEQLLQTVSAVTSGGTQVAASASGATTGGISSTSLRGLDSRRTLILVNGRRVAPYGIGFTQDSVSVDVNSIPLSAIERVEVLKDGASAVYGSDAIAGVINFILRRDFTGLELSAEAGRSDRNDAGTGRVTASWGRGDLTKDGFNFMLFGSYQKEQPLYGRDRDFASKSYNLSTLNNNTSGNTFPANIDAVDGSFPKGSPNNPSAATGCKAPYSFLPPAELGYNPGVCRFDPAPLVSLLPDTERASLFGSAKFTINNELEAFVEASYNRNSIRTIIQPVPLSDQFNLPLNNPLANQFPYNINGLPVSTILLTTASPFYPTTFVQGITGGATPDLLVRYRSAVTGNRDFTDISEAPRLTFGLKGVAKGWDFDTAFLYTSSKVRERVTDGYPVNSKILPLLNSGTVNFFGPNTPDIDAALRATNFTGDAFTTTSSITSVGAKASKDIVDLPAGPMALALGLEERKEKYNFDPSTEIAQGDVSGYGGNLAAVDKSRNVSSVFAEINVPIVKNLEAGAAVRYDRYQGSGESTTPKATLRYQPVKEVLLRASVGRGFRAPSLADLYSPPTTNVTETGLSDPLRCPTTGDGIKDCTTQFAVANGGNPALKPERSRNITFGIVFEPTNNLSVGVEAFKILLKDTINQGIGSQAILGDLAKYGKYVTRGPVDPAFPTLPGPIASIDLTNLNTGETNLAGYDLDARWRHIVEGVGRVTLAFSGTYTQRYDIQNPDGSFTPAVGTALIPGSNSGGVIPRWKTYQSVNLVTGPWDLTLAMSYQNGYQDIASNCCDPGVERRVAAYKVFDFAGGYNGFEHLKLAFGIKNLFDRDPPFTNQGFSFQAGYDPQYADPRGRFLYGRATYVF